MLEIEFPAKLQQVKVLMEIDDSYNNFLANFSFLFRVSFK
jgi:hypothetical protein